MIRTFPLTSGSFISYKRKSISISPRPGKSSSKNTTSQDSISITLPFISFPKKTYPLEYSEYLMKIHFFPYAQASHTHEKYYEHRLRIPMVA